MGGDDQEIIVPAECTNRELFLLLSQMHRDQKNFITVNSEEHKGIVTRQDYTNGDVRKLKLWKAKILGAFAAVTFIFSVILALMPTIIKAMND